jgi:hypothetical protein
MVSGYPKFPFAKPQGPAYCFLKRELCKSGKILGHYDEINLTGVFESFL